MSKNAFERTLKSDLYSETKYQPSTISSQVELKIKNLLKEIQNIYYKITEINQTLKQGKKNIEPKIKKLLSLEKTKKNLKNQILIYKNALSIESKNRNFPRA
jgi:predicted  nucleic acid-binding Zn-ribbon protein